MRAMVLAWDLETTGLRVGLDRIVQFGFAYADDAGMIVSRGSRLINPGVSIPRDSTETHGIANVHVADAPTLADAWDFIGYHLSGQAAREQGRQLVGIVAHNGEGFDVPFIEAEAARLGLGYRWDIPRFDSMLLGWGLDPGQSRSLGEMAKRSGVTLRNAHSAGDDAQATALVFIDQVKRAGGFDRARTLQEAARRSTMLYGRALFHGPAGIIWTQRGANCGKLLTEVSRRALVTLSRQENPAVAAVAREEMARRDTGRQQDLGIEVDGTVSLDQVEAIILRVCQQTGVSPCGDEIEWGEVGGEFVRVGITIADRVFSWRSTSVNKKTAFGATSMSVRGQAVNPPEDVDSIVMALCG